MITSHPGTEPNIQKHTLCKKGVIIGPTHLATRASDANLSDTSRWGAWFCAGWLLFANSGLVV